MDQSLLIEYDAFDQYEFNMIFIDLMLTENREKMIISSGRTQDYQLSQARVNNRYTKR